MKRCNSIPPLHVIILPFLVCIGTSSAMYHWATQYHLHQHRGKANTGIATAPPVTAAYFNPALLYRRDSLRAPLMLQYGSAIMEVDHDVHVGASYVPPDTNIGGFSASTDIVWINHDYNMCDILIGYGRQLPSFSNIEHGFGMSMHYMNRHDFFHLMKSKMLLISGGYAGIFPFGLKYGLVYNMLLEWGPINEFITLPESSGMGIGYEFYPLGKGIVKIAPELDFGVSPDSADHFNSYLGLGLECTIIDRIYARCGVMATDFRHLYSVGFGARVFRRFRIDVHLFNPMDQFFYREKGAHEKDVNEIGFSITML